MSTFEMEKYEREEFALHFGIFLKIEYFPGQELLFKSNISHIFFFNVTENLQNVVFHETKQFRIENVCDLEVFRWNPARRNINIRSKKRVSIPNTHKFVSMSV